MFSIVVTEKGGAQKQHEFQVRELNIGRTEDNEVVLPKNNVSKRHARIVIKDGRYVLIDMKSTNGTYVNGRRITAPMAVGKGDKIYIGDFILGLAAPIRLETMPFDVRQDDTVAPPPLDDPGGSELPRAMRPTPPSIRRPPNVGTQPSGSDAPGPNGPSGPSTEKSAPPAMAAAASVPASPPPTPAAPAPPARHPGAGTQPGPSMPPREPSVPPRLEDPESGQGPATSPAVLTPSLRLQGALGTLMERLGERMDLYMPEERAFPSEHHATLKRLVDELEAEGVIGPDLDRRFLVESAVNEAVGLGPLDRLVNNRSVREIVVDSPSRIMADLGGGLSAVSSFFSSTPAVRTVAARLLKRAGRPLLDGAVQSAQLPDGSHVTVLLPPVSPAGPMISVRCPVAAPISPESLITEGVLSLDMLNLLRRAVNHRHNVLVVGRVGAGVSTLLGALASLAHDHGRVVTVERTPSLALAHPQVIALQRAGYEGPLTDLLQHAARLRYDHLVLDDVGGDDALSIITTAASTRGVLMGTHAASPSTALEQLEMFAQTQLRGSSTSMASLFSHAFQVIVHLDLGTDGARRVQSISAVVGARDRVLDVRALYTFDGNFRATEHRAGFLSS